MQGNGRDKRGSPRLSDVLGPVLNFSVAIFGAGWIVMPLTATQMGLIIACLSILGVGMLNAYACTTLLRAAEELGAPESYHELTEKVLGRKWALLLDFFVALASTLSCAQRLILVGDYGVVLKHRLITRRYQPVRPLIVLLLTAVLAAPLAYSRALRKVEKVSAFSMLCILVAFGITIYTLVDTIAGDGLPTGEIKYANWSPNLLLAFPTQEFAYAGQQAILPIYRELRNRSLERGKLVVYISFGICIGIYLSFGIVGYLQYPGALEGDFFNLYEDKAGAVYTALYFLLIIGVIGSFPVSVFVGRTHLGYLLLGKERSEEPKWIYVLASFFLLSSVGIAVAIKNLGVVQGLGGGLGNSFINLVVPAFALLKMLKKDKERGMEASGKGGAESKEGREVGKGPDEVAQETGQRVSSPELLEKNYHPVGEARQQELEGARVFNNGLFVSEGDDVASSGTVDPVKYGAREEHMRGHTRRMAPAGAVLEGQQSSNAAHAKQSESKGSRSELFQKLAAYFLLTVAALQAGTATVGNLVSLCLVGWDDASNTFYT